MMSCDMSSGAFLNYVFFLLLWKKEILMGPILGGNSLAIIMLLLLLHNLDYLHLERDKYLDVSMHASSCKINKKE